MYSPTIELLGAAYRNLTSNLEEQFSSIDKRLSYEQAITLSTLETLSHQGLVPKTLLANTLKKHRATITSITGKLEKNGYIYETMHPTNKKMRICFLSTEGMRVASLCKDILKKQEREISQLFKHDEHYNLQNALDHLGNK